jgi:hypothetical protein
MIGYIGALITGYIGVLMIGHIGALVTGYIGVYIIGQPCIHV